MSIWSVAAIAYVAVRTVIAGVLLVHAVRRRVSGILAAQAISDAAVAVLVLAYALYPLRAALGWVSVLLFLFFVGWELLAATRRLDLMGETPGDPMSDVELLGGTARWVWDACNLAPAFVIGALVVGSVVWRGGYTLPGTPSALKCTPADVHSGDDLILRMKTPHGGDLGVFTPRRGYLILRSPVAAGSVPETEGFEHQGLLALPIESFTGLGRHAPADEAVFADSGTYTFSMSEYRDASVAFTCAVHYRP